jgi:formylglycine-generating enzyme required for sulfatase activity
VVTSIFISHSSQDADDALRLAEDLKRTGLEVWLDEWEIAVGDRITQKIQRGISGADYLAVWITETSLQSRWVETEWQTKYESETSSGRVTVLPLLAENCTLPDFLAGKRYADFRHDYAKGLADLLKVVGLKDWQGPFGMKFSLIMPGAFMMGSPEGDDDKYEENERPLHQVTVGRPFYIGTYAVTQATWREVMETAPWKGMPHAREGGDYPVTWITWYDVQAFLARISEMDKQNSYYLPTEEEWEYAARAGTNSRFSFGDDEREMRSYGWYRDITQNAEEYAHEVGRKGPNPWGLYDIHGNVWEWMDDWHYGSYSVPPRLNPFEKVLRGGGWDFPAHGARSAFRNKLLPSRTGAAVGFRLLRKPAQVP